jgi:hypothetical protein
MRFVLAVLASLGAVCALAQTPTDAQKSSRQATLVGCVAMIDEGFVLKTTSSARRTGGSSSAKASTPIGSGQSAALAADHEPHGSNSAKASTPIHGATVYDLPRTAGGLTPKGSAPIAAQGNYMLESAGVDLAAFIDQLVEIAIPQSSGQSRILRVERVRTLSTACQQ